MIWDLNGVIFPISKLNRSRIKIFINLNFDGNFCLLFFLKSSLVLIDKADNSFKYKHRTSMMWPSQNFFLYVRNVIKVKVTEWINNLKKYVIPPPLWGYIQHVQIITI